MKRRLAKRYISSSTKWKLVLKAIGKLYRAIYYELDKEEGSSSVKALADTAFKVGRNFRETLKRYFQLGNTIEDISFTMEVEHNVFGTKAAVTEKSKEKIVYYCYECAWKKYFKPKLRIAIGQAEKGMA